MSETNAQEPTMEEILASIRRIISEDDPPTEAPAPATAAPSPPPVSHAPMSPAPVSQSPASEPPPVEPQSAPAPKAESPPPPPEPVNAFDDDVLELTDPVQSPEPATASHTFQETLGDLEVFSTAASPPAPAFTPAAPPYPAEPLVGSYASEATAGHFGALARSVSMPKEGRSLEDVVREMLKPMLRDWLDQHLPSIVEARVQAEVERIARRHDY